MCMFILLTSNEDQKIPYALSEQIHTNLLKEEPKMRELRLQINSKHKGDCKKPGDILTAG